MVAESLQVGNLGNNARDLPVRADPTHDCQIEPLGRGYPIPMSTTRGGFNNTKFNEIKASIRASGLRNPFTVTRRPGESHFVVEAGGNTRLLGHPATLGRDEGAALPQARESCFGPGARKVTCSPPTSSRTSSAAT
jgi:hypothetical protein